MLFDLDRVKKNVHQASTEDLLDRVTVYRAGMENEALSLMEQELRRRGITRAQIEAHEAQRRRESAFLPDGTAVRCSFCYRPAVGEGWGWHRLWGRLPVFPRFYHYCREHMPARDAAGDANQEASSSPDELHPPA